MNKGRRAGLKNRLSKPTWEIMKIMSEITKFISMQIFGAFFGLRTTKITKQHERKVVRPLFLKIMGKHNKIETNLKYWLVWLFIQGKNRKISAINYLYCIKKYKFYAIDMAN